MLVLVNLWTVEVMSGYNEAAVMEKLGKLNESQESIQTLAQWIMYHRKYAAQSVKIWADMIQKGEERRRHSCLKKKKKKKSKLLGSVEKWLRQFCFHQDREATVFCWDLSLDLTFLFFFSCSFLFSFPFFFLFFFFLFFPGSHDAQEAAVLICGKRYCAAQSQEGR